MSKLIWSLALTLLTIALPGLAHASTASVDGTTLRYEAAPAEVNYVSFDLQNGNYTLQDSGVTTMTYGAPCAQWPLQGGLGSGALCPAPGIERAVAVLGSDGDRWWTGAMSSVPIAVDLYGEEGNDQLRGSEYGDLIVGGPGEDNLDGVGGNDTIEARDGASDTIACGAGIDKVGADAVDAVAADCEQTLDGAVIGRPPSKPGADNPAEGFIASIVAPKRWNARRWKDLAFGVTCSRVCGIDAKVTWKGRTIARERDWLRPGTKHPRVFAMVAKPFRKALWRARPAKVAIEVEVVDLSDDSSQPLRYTALVKVKR